MPLNQLFLLESVVLLFLMWWMIINTIRTMIADLKQGLPTQIASIIALYVSFHCMNARANMP